MREPTEQFFCSKCGTGAFCQPVNKKQPVNSNKQPVSKKKSIEGAKATSVPKRKEHFETGTKENIGKQTQKKTNKTTKYSNEQCRKHPESGEMVFCAEWYGNWLSSTGQFFLELCKDCNLSPCITLDREKVGRARVFALDAMHPDEEREANHHDEEGVTKTYVKSQTAIFLQKVRCKLLEQRYGLRKKIPACIRNHVETKLMNLYGFEDLPDEATG